MKRKWKIGLAALCVVGLVTVVCAAGGPDDPLVTLSYLKNVFTGQVEEMVDQAVAAGQEEVQSEVDSAIRDWDARVSAAIDGLPQGSGGQDAQFVRLTLQAGQKLTLQAGCELIVTSGSLAGGADLVDETAGATLSAGGTLSANHLYLAGGECVLTIPAGQRTGTVREGPLNVRSGPGSGYSVLGRLAAGAAVTVLDTSNSSWYRISGGGLTGYAAAGYLTLDPAVQTGPVTLMARGAYTVS